MNKKQFNYKTFLVIFLIIISIIILSVDTMKAKYTKTLVVTDDLNLTIGEYKLTLDANDGLINNQSIIESSFSSGDVYGKLPIPTKEGYTFKGWSVEKEGDDLVKETDIVENRDITLYAKWNINTYKNTVTFWAWGLKGEGNNNQGTALQLANIKTIEIASEYGSDFEFTKEMASEVPIPNGYTFSQFGSATVDDERWQRYNFGIVFKQKPWVMNAEYEYDPISYSITYILDGGINSKSNPQSYTVLYGVTFEEPTKEGYTFDGWYIDEVKVTGINENCTNDFGATPNTRFSKEVADNFYESLSNRTTGNIIVTAHWIAN